MAYRRHVADTSEHDIDAAIGRLVRAHVELDARTRGLYWTIHRAAGAPPLTSKAEDVPAEFRQMIDHCRIRRLPMLSVPDQAKFEDFCTRALAAHEQRNRYVHDWITPNPFGPGHVRARWQPTGFNYAGPREPIYPTDIDQVTEELRTCGRLASELSTEINQSNVEHWTDCT
jgi:hypothetical protein